MTLMTGMPGRSVLMNFLRYKMYLGRAYSHLSVILTPLSLVMATATFLKVYGLASESAIILISVLLITALFIVGYFDVHKKVYEQEQDINNQQNPQLMLILKKLDEIKEGKP